MQASAMFDLKTPWLPGDLTLPALPAPRFPDIEAANLTADEESLLVQAYNRQRYAPQDGGDLADGFFPVRRENQNLAEMLVYYGYLEHFKIVDPKTRRIWYRITEKGQRRAELKAPDWGLFNVTVLPGLCRHQRRLEQARSENLQRLVAEMLAQGYAVLPEQERGLRYGQLAFFQMEKGHKRLYSCRLGCPDWNPHRGTGYYYRPGDDPDEGSHEAQFVRVMEAF